MTCASCGKNKKIKLSVNESFVNPLLQEQKRLLTEQAVIDTLYEDPSFTAGLGDDFLEMVKNLNRSFLASGNYSSGMAKSESIIKNRLDEILKNKSFYKKISDKIKLDPRAIKGEEDIRRVADDIAEAHSTIMASLRAIYELYLPSAAVHVSQDLIKLTYAQIAAGSEKPKEKAGPAKADRLQEIKIRIAEKKTLSEMDDFVFNVPSKHSVDDARAMAAEMSRLDSRIGHILLDIVGFVDPSGIADGINAAWYFAEGNVAFGLISVIGAAIPYAGDAVKLTKIIKISKNTGLPIKQMVTEAMENSGDIIKALEIIGKNSPKALDVAQEIKRLQNAPIAKAVKYFKTMFGLLDEGADMALATSKKQAEKTAAKAMEIAGKKKMAKGASEAFIKKLIKYKIRELTFGQAAIQVAVGYSLGYTKAGQDFIIYLVGLPIESAKEVLTIFDKKDLDQMSDAALNSSVLSKHPKLQEYIFDVLGEAKRKKLTLPFKIEESAIKNIKILIKEEKDLLKEASPLISKALGRQIKTLVKAVDIGTLSKQLDALLKEADLVFKNASLRGKLNLKQRIQYLTKFDEYLTGLKNTVDDEADIVRRNIGNKNATTPGSGDYLISKAEKLEKFSEKITEQQPKIASNKKALEAQAKAAKDKAAETAAVVAKGKPGAEPKVSLKVKGGSTGKGIAKIVLQFYVSNVVCRFGSTIALAGLLEAMIGTRAIRSMLKTALGWMGAIGIGAKYNAYLTQMKPKPNTFKALGLVIRDLVKASPLFVGCYTGFKSGFGNLVQSFSLDATGFPDDWNEVQYRIKDEINLSDKEYKSALLLKAPELLSIQTLVQPVGSLADIFSPGLLKLEGSLAEELNKQTWLTGYAASALSKVLPLALGREATVDVASEKIPQIIDYVKNKVLNMGFLPDPFIIGFMNINNFLSSQGVKSEHVGPLAICILKEYVGKTSEKMTRSQRKKMGLWFKMAQDKIDASITKSIGEDQVEEIKKAIIEFKKEFEKIKEGPEYKNLDEAAKKEIEALLSYFPDDPNKTPSCDQLYKKYKKNMATIRRVFGVKGAKTKPKDKEPEEKAPEVKPEENPLGDVEP